MIINDVYSVTIPDGLETPDHLVYHSLGSKYTVEIVNASLIACEAKLTVDGVYIATYNIAAGSTVVLTFKGESSEPFIFDKSAINDDDKDGLICVEFRPVFVESLRKDDITLKTLDGNESAIHVISTNPLWTTSNTVWSTYFVTNTTATSRTVRTGPVLLSERAYIAYLRLVPYPKITFDVASSEQEVVYQSRFPKLPKQGDDK